MYEGIGLMERLAIQNLKKLERDRKNTAFKSSYSPKWKHKGRKSLTVFFLREENSSFENKRNIRKKKKKGSLADLQEKYLDLRESHIWQVPDERAKLQNHLLCGELKRRMKHKGFDSTAHPEQHDRRVLPDHITSHNHSTPPRSGFVFVLGIGWLLFLFVCCFFPDFQLFRDWGLVPRNAIYSPKYQSLYSLRSLTAEGKLSN